MNSMRKFRILIVCPEPQGLTLLSSMLRSLGHLIEEAATDRVAVRFMERNPINLVLASVDPADSEALELLSYVRRKHPDVPVILMFPRVHPDRAREALRLGATAVLKYPVPAGELRAAVLQALEQCEAQPAVPAQVACQNSGTVGQSGRVDTADGAPPHGPQVAPDVSNGAPHPPGNHALILGADTHPAATATLSVTAARANALVRPPASPRDIDLVTADPALKQIVELGSALCASSSSLLIVGEPGTGKALLARFLHLGSSPERPLIVLDSEQIGEAADSATEAEADAPDPAAAMSEWVSKLAQARGGTFLVEEVGALPADLQLQLLRELQLHDMEAAAGHTRPRAHLSARIILTSSESLSLAMEQGRFRPDLYHRINAFSLMIPPLRHRGADIELLAEHFRAGFAQEFRKDVVGLTRDAVEALLRHDWPGNVRELKGVLQRAVARCAGPRITSSHLAPILNLHRQSRGGAAGTSRPHLPMGIRPLKEALEDPEKRIIIQALQAFNWNRQETARVLDINRTTLYKKMKKYGLLMDEPMWAN
jgi:two-component system response regulator HydG